MATDDRYYMPFQYGNEANVKAHYDGTGPEILDDLPEVKAFVAGLGTGGTLTGVGRRLKEHNPEIKVIAAEPELGELVYGLRSLDEDTSRRSSIRTSSTARSRSGARSRSCGPSELLDRRASSPGISAGAVIWVAQRVGERLGADGRRRCRLSAPGRGLEVPLDRGMDPGLDIAEEQVEDVLWW